MRHFYEMIIIMIIAGTLSTMNNWAYSVHHMRFSLNDVYMISLMTGWMVLLMAILHRTRKFFIIGLTTVVLSIMAIRNQWFITYNQYVLGMIPHHSMALTMSAKFLDKPLPRQIYDQQLIELQEFMG
jgi:peptidoglycan biosynthesis protein MviN/MurJ (putative lipid II flippase)